MGKRKERDLDKGDPEADGSRKRFREIRGETSDGLKVRKFLSEVGGDYFNIHFAMPAESTGWFGISMFQ